jgi:rhodanese-related sulfurtransferase
MMINFKTVLLLVGVSLIISIPGALAHTDVTPEEAHELISTMDDLTVVDVREPSEYCDNRGHIPGAVNYPLTSGVLYDRYEELPMDGPILVVCRSGGRSNQAATFLDSKGFSMVYDMMGGMNNWIWETESCVESDEKYSGGTGEPNDPYQIATAEDLIALGETPEDYDKHFILTADIDLDPNLPGRKVFSEAVIGAGSFVDINPGTFIGIDPNAFIDIGAFISSKRFEGTPFTGVLDGNGHTISHLTIIGESYLGLFGLLENGATISNLGLEAVNVNGAGDCVGALVGENSGGIIASCYTNGNISGSQQVGGLVGYNSSGTVAYCFCTGTVNGKGRVGGLVGWNDSEITNCYAAAKVLGNKPVGGLVGGYSEGMFSTSRITNCYFPTSRYGGGPDNGLGFPLTDERMKEPSSFLGWDFIGRPDGPDDIWAEPIEGGYPILWWQLSPLPELPFLSGKGESNDPYLISTMDELNNIGHNPRLMTAHFKLINDIDLAGIDLFMIGSEIFPFSGVFDGNGHTISNFNHITKYVDFVGLFGYVKGPKAEIRDLGIINPNINLAIGDVGSLAGYFGDGTISNCYSDSGSVSGYGSVGGLLGTINNGSITNCHSSTTVSGTNTVGGLAGSFVGLIRSVSDQTESTEYIGIISNCYSTGSVSGDRNVGGLVGTNYGYMTNCYTTGDVSGVWLVGGLVGRNLFGQMTNSYAKASVTGNVSVGGLVGSNEYTSTISNCNSIGSVSGDGNVGGLVGANLSGHMVNCYAKSTVAGDYYVGGLVGRNLEGSISSSYSTGSVIGTEKVGGLVGENTLVPDQQGQYSIGIIDSSFWDMETSGQTTSDGGIGLTTIEMQTTSTFLDDGWDFVGETANGTEDIWWIDEGQDYPRLWWEASE